MVNIDDRNAVRDVIADGGLRPFLARLLGKCRTWFGGDRFSALSGALAKTIGSLQDGNSTMPKLLDFGCGNMAISRHLVSIGVAESAFGVDTYPVSALSQEKSGCYKQIVSGKRLPFFDREFDVAICVDVLHHIGVGDSAEVLRELGRVSRFVIVKDHFESDLISRQLLRLADWYGNFAYGVNVPDRYYDPGLWSKVVQAAELKEVHLETPVRIHKGLFGLIIRPDNHFISILSAT
jgi:SAM-dependent methyltransferase